MSRVAPAPTAPPPAASGVLSRFTRTDTIQTPAMLKAAGKAVQDGVKHGVKEVVESKKSGTGHHQHQELSLRDKVANRFFSASFNKMIRMYDWRIGLVNRSTQVVVISLFIYELIYSQSWALHGLARSVGRGDCDVRTVGRRGLGRDVESGLPPGS